MQESEETRMMGLPDGRKSFKIGLAVLIQYRRVTSIQTATQPRRRSIYRAYYVVLVKNILAVESEAICKWGAQCWREAPAEIFLMCPHFSLVPPHEEAQRLFVTD